MTYTGSKRCWRDKPYTTPDNGSNNKEMRSEPEKAHYFSSFSDFLISNDIMGSRNNFDYCAMCTKTRNATWPLSINERRIPLYDHRLYVSPIALHYVYYTLLWETMSPLSGLYSCHISSSTAPDQWSSPWTFFRLNTGFLHEDDRNFNDNNYTCIS